MKPKKKYTKRPPGVHIGQTAMEEAFIAARTAPAEKLAAIPPTDAERIAALERDLTALVDWVGKGFVSLETWSQGIHDEVAKLYENDKVLASAIDRHVHPLLIGRPL